MRKSLLVLFAYLFTSVYAQAYAADNQAGGINWYTNYDEAVKASKASSKPLLLLFTGSDWCTWCIRLESEALNTPEFAQAAGDKFIFVKLDFPVHKTLPLDVTAYNKQLQSRFGVTGFPSVVLLDANQQKQIGSTGYKAGGGKAYADHLLKMLEGHTAYIQKVQTLDQHLLSGVDLKELYERAKELGRQQEASEIATQGIESDQDHYFMLERYRLLAEQGLVNSSDAIMIKHQLLHADPSNLRLTHYQLAIIDFEASCREKASADSSEQAVAVLTNYIEKFGNQDKENLWRLQMMIAQVYVEENQLPKALEYAQSSYQSAPPTAQPRIALTIKNLQAKSHL